MPTEVRLSLIATLVLLSGPAIAAPLSWPELVQEAGRSNPDLAADRANAARAQNALAQTYSPFLPSLTGRLSVNRANAPLDTSYENSLTAQYNVFSGLGDTARLRQARADVTEAEARLAGTAADISRQLKSAFARLLYAQEQLDLNGAIAERRKSNLRLVELRYDVGRENKGSFLRTRADYRAALFDVNQSSRSLRTAQRELARVLGRSDFETLEATGTFQTSDLATAADFRALARTTPAVRQSQAQLRRSEAGRLLAWSGFSPSLDANATGSRSGNDWPPDRDRWSLGASLSIPFFSGGRTLFDARRAEEDRKRAAFALQSAESTAAQDLEESWAGFQDAIENVAVQKEYEEAGQVRAQIARGQYANGLLSFQDWDFIENDLINRQNSRLAALRDALLAEAAWESAQGAGAIRP